MAPGSISTVPITTSGSTPPSAGPGAAGPMLPPPPPLLLEVDGMKCAGCARAVEQRLLAQSGVLQASVNLLQRSAWVALDPGATAGCPPQQLAAPLLEALAGLGFAAQLRDDAASLAAIGSGSEAAQRRQGDWWSRWRQLVVALTLLLVSVAGHLAESGAAAWLPVGLGQEGVHALVATIALLGPGRSILVRGARAFAALAPTMDSLVGLGMASAYLASLLGLLVPAAGWPCFFNEPVMLLAFVLLGRFLEERARARTGDALAALARLQPEEALLLIGSGPPRPVRVGGLRPGDRIQVLPGDRLPVDGVVLEGRSQLDVASLTGEVLPQEAGPGSELAAGSLNLEATLVLEVRRCGAESAVARILQLVERALARKAPIQGLADRVSGRFAWFVLALALATFLFWWLWGAARWPQVLMLPGGHAGHAAAMATPFGLALQLAIAVLVVACPCALGLATPAAITVGCGLAARGGLLFRGGDAIETAAGLRTVLFDKTGTLTRGRPLVQQVLPLAGACSGAGHPGPADRLVQLAASLEQQSRHPLAHALLQEAQRRELALLPVTAVRSEAGQGVEGILAGPEGSRVRVGRPAWLQPQGSGAAPEDPLRVDLEHRAEVLAAGGASVLAVAENDQPLGLVVVEDQPRPDAAATLAALRRRHLRLGLLSGDRRAAVQRLGGQLGFEPGELAWELRPEQKLERLEAARHHGPVAMVGDGINDAPALAAADLGIAVGTGTQIAQDSADLVVLGERLGGVLDALVLAGRTMAKVRQNLIWAFGYNLVALPLAAGLLLPRWGLLLSPPLAALLMALSSITVVVNALLLQRGSAGVRR